MLVKLTHPNGDLIYVNPDHVVSVQEKHDDKSKSNINLRDQSTGWIVQGRAELVVSILNGEVRP